jgi:transcriptional regulator with XRE-family HTH domain
MKRAKQEKLKKRGWAVGTVADFLALTPEEAAFVEIKLALSDALRAQRQKAKLSQAQVAKQLGSSQSRVAKMETGDPSVTLDLLVRSLLVLGATKKTVGRTIEAARNRGRCHFCHLLPLTRTRPGRCSGGAGGGGHRIASATTAGSQNSEFRDGIAHLWGGALGRRPRTVSASVGGLRHVRGAGQYCEIAFTPRHPARRGAPRSPRSARSACSSAGR